MDRKLLKGLMRHRPSAIQIAAVALAIIVSAIIFFSKGENFAVQWEQWIYKVIIISTLVIAVFVWFNERIEQLERSLPKKLDVEYRFNNKVYATVSNAPLAGEDDIRQWGISMGQTILNDKVSIGFSGFKTQGPKRNSKRNIMQYKLTVYLLEPIINIPEGSSFTFDEKGDLTEPSKVLAKKIKKDNPSDKPGTIKI